MKYKDEPDKAQRVHMGKTFGYCRFVHNTFLALRRDAWKKNHVSLNYEVTSGILTATTAWLSASDAAALQDELKRMDCACEG